MDFFKTVFSDEPPPADPDSPSPEDAQDPQDPPADNPDPGAASSGGAWNFGDMIKTLATKSESVIQTYRRDLEELGSGLRKETEVIREAASRAVKDLPASLEVGASVAQESLESVGQALDDFSATVWKSTAEIISQSKEVLLDLDSDYADYSNSGDNTGSGSQLHSYGSQGLEVKKYSRFEAQVRALQCDTGTYCDEPEDKEDYGGWRSGFVLDEKDAEIEILIQENGVVREIYGTVVPAILDRETFWGRYFYRLHKLKQAEDARSRLVNRAISGEEDEDLRWDFDDDEEEGGEGSASSPKNANLESAVEGSKKEENTMVETKSSAEPDAEILDETNSSTSEGKVEEKDKSESSESCKDSDISIVTQPSILEEDLGWDEIEDVVSNDESKGDNASSSASRVDARKMINATEEEEDLSWDIEEDDEPPKAQ